MKTIYKIIALSALGLLATGCLISGTFVTDVDFTASFTNGFEKISVDLADYTDRSEDIDRVERVDVEGIIRNDENASDTIRVYMSSNATYTTKAAVESAADAYLLVIDYPTKPGPGSFDTLTIEEARAFINIPSAAWDQIKEVVKTGTFCVYITSTGTGVSGAVTEGYLWITFTAKA